MSQIISNVNVKSVKTFTTQKMVKIYYKFIIIYLIYIIIYIKNLECGLLNYKPNKLFTFLKGIYSKD